MRKYFLLLMGLILSWSAAMAADIDLTTAQSVARSFMSKQVANGRLRAAAASNLKLAKAEASVVNPKAVDYYIFNAEKSYVVVAGDDLAPAILMYGEEGTIDLNDIPPAMQWLLNKYKYQIDGLKAGTHRPNFYSPKAVTAVPPMVTANWDQSAPYNNQCPTSGSRRTLTGCPATSLSMCYYKWKWPKTFPAVAAINSSSSGGVSAAALPERTADWDNIIDEYTGPSNTSYNTTQANAVAWLMRYAGQAIPDYSYGTSASGANDPEIYQGVLNMGYTDAQYLMLTELVQSGWSYGNSAQKYTDAQWNEWMLAELHSGRPIEYLAYDITSGQVSGHAFNVFGCDASGKYYVNWGWSGDSNGYCALHNFTTATGATGQSGSFVFKYGEAMIIGIEPPAGALGPNISVTPTTLAFEGYVGDTYTKTFNVKGSNLTGNITIAKSGSNVYSVSPTTITSTQAQSTNGVNVTVTYAPTATGNTSATLTLSSNGAESQTVTLSGTAQAKTPTLTITPTSITFNAGLGVNQTKTIAVTGKFITNDITVALTDASNVFGVSISGAKTANSVLKASGTYTIPASSINETNPVYINVSFNSATAGSYTGKVTLTSTGAQTKTINLTATAEEETGGTASDKYLDVAKYSTIDDAGWNTSYVNNFYQYTEDATNNCGWLTLPVYGAWTGYRYQNNAGPQKWISSNITTNTAASSVYVEGNWSANDVFKGSSVYFTSATNRRFGNTSTNAYTERTISFYVTNTTAIKLRGQNNKSNSLRTYPTTLSVYECQENADGTLSDGTTAVKTTSNTTSQATFNLSLADLDKGKIYKVVASLYRAQFYEIAFQTPLPSIAVDPEELDYVAEPGQTITQSFTVTGSGLREDVAVQLTDDNGVYSVPVTSISKNDANTGYTVNVTFNAPETMGSYRGKVTLTSGNATAEVGLYGSVGERGTAFSEYLDVGREYESLGLNNWYSGVFAQPYSFTEDETNECAWLTVPAMMSYAGYMLNDHMWTGVSQYSDYYSGLTWNATDVFKGSTYFYGSNTALVMGSNSTSTNNTQVASMIYNVTNCSQVKAYMYNQNTSTSYPAIIRIYELTENADGSLTSGDTYVDNVTVSTTGEQTIASSELDPNKIYQVLVAGARSFYYEVSFKTPLTNRPGVPTIVSAEPTATTSEVTWTSGENNDSWNLRYRPYVEATTETILWDFPNDDAILDQQLEGWGIYDADGDGNNWGLYYTDDSQTDLVWGSESYDGTNDLTPDNRLYTPNVTLGGTLKFKAAIGQANWPDKIGVYVIPDGEETAYFIQDVSPQAVMPSFAEYEIDLSQFEGTGQIIFRHYESDGNVAIFIDDIEVTYSSGTQPEWIYVNDVTSPYTIEGLTPETTYEVQVQGVNDISTSAWTASTLFTTLAIEGQDLAYIEEHGVPGTTYRVSNELVAVDYAIVGDEVYLWCKDQGNASIAPAPAVGDKIDYLRNDQYAQNGRAWDESNWVVLKFTPGSVAEKVKSITDAVGHELNAGTITGVYSDAVNYTITMPAGEGMPAGAVGDESSYAPNVYCVANFNPANLTADGAQSNENGNVYFFMTPKVQEVCEITYAYWNAENFIVPTTSGFVGSLSLNWAYNADGDVTDDLNADNVYRFKTVVQRTGITMTPALKAEGGNYKVAPLNLTSASKADIPTAIGTVKAGVDVVDVYYVNSIGVMSKTPFHGVNVVVTRYSDGSRSSVKKVFK